LDGDGDGDGDGEIMVGVGAGDSIERDADRLRRLCWWSDARHTS
jgi:hypothetical protein